MDSVNRKIIEMLQNDGRVPYSDIAAYVNLSEAAVRKRVKKLESEGVIDIVAVTDPKQMGFPRQALVGITVDGDVEPVLAHLRELEEITYLVVTTGRYDILAEIVARSDSHLKEAIYKKVRATDGVRSTETFQYLEINKQIYNWGVI